MKKVTKKSRLMPASLEKLAFRWLKPSKLAPASLKQDSFKRQLHLFFGSPRKVGRPVDLEDLTDCFADNQIIIRALFFK